MGRPSPVQHHQRLPLGWRGGSSRPPCLLWTEPGLSFQTVQGQAGSYGRGRTAPLSHLAWQREDTALSFIFVIKSDTSLLKLSTGCALNLS